MLLENREGISSGENVAGLIGVVKLGLPFTGQWLLDKIHHHPVSEV